MKNQLDAQTRGKAGIGSATLDELAARYTMLHTKKEELFWDAMMGLSPDSAATRSKLASAEIELSSFLSDPANITRVSTGGSSATTDEERKSFTGWERLFRAHALPSVEARKLANELLEREQALAQARTTMALGYTNPNTGVFERASSVQLSLLMKTSPDERVRKAAYEGLRSIEGFALANGFIEMLKLRNRIGRLAGHANFYEWKAKTNEGMSMKHLFGLLDELERRTRTAAETSLADFRAANGDHVLEPWNFVYVRRGDLARSWDPYFRFGTAVERWGKAFTGLGIKFRGAELTLDLVDRPGKYENGFMHAPEVAFFDHGAWRRARVNFTANAVPGAVGSGRVATDTLFHEGGHAAHFSNILQNAPCFSLEFAPTSVAYAETQSMFCDSLVGDADFITRYAVDTNGAAAPMELIEQSVREGQRFAAWDLRAMMTVPFAERGIYELPDDQMTPERILAVCREAEIKLQSLTAGVRPMLAVPHLLSNDSSAYYHGYVLASMAVQQTRTFFLKRDGYLTDNSRIGPEMAAAYWAPGNSISFDETLVALTGSPLGPDAITRDVTRSVDDAIAETRTTVERSRTRSANVAVNLDARVRVIHGNEVIADSQETGFEVAANRFALWVDGLETTAAR